MRFKEFLHKEESGGGDRGLMGGDPKPTGRKPSDGQPFARFLSDFITAQSSQGGGGMDIGGQPMFMKKKMKKKMKKD